MEKDTTESASLAANQNAALKRGAAKDSVLDNHPLAPSPVKKGVDHGDEKAKRREPEKKEPKKGLSTLKKTGIAIVGLACGLAAAYFYARNQDQTNALAAQESAAGPPPPTRSLKELKTTAPLQGSGSVEKPKEAPQDDTWKKGSMASRMPEPSAANEQGVGPSVAIDEMMRSFELRGGRKASGVPRLALECSKRLVEIKAVRPKWSAENGLYTQAFRTMTDAYIDKCVGVDFSSKELDEARAAMEAARADIEKKAIAKFLSAAAMRSEGSSASDEKRSAARQREPMERKECEWGYMEESGRCVKVVLGINEEVHITGHSADCKRFARRNKAGQCSFDSFVPER